jgi:hypothetical protein
MSSTPRFVCEKVIGVHQNISLFQLVCEEVVEEEVETTIRFPAEQLMVDDCTSGRQEFVVLKLWTRDHQTDREEV